MSRYAPGTGYAGPLVNYDDMTSPESFVRRVVYGRPEPLLGERGKMDTPFFGRLFSELANAHVVYVKECNTEGSARVFLCKLRKELPLELYEAGIQREDPHFPGWHVFVYNKIEKSMGNPRRDLVAKPVQHWLDANEAARMLHVTPGHVRRMARQMGIRIEYTNRRMFIPRQAIVTLSHRRKRRPNRNPKRT